MVLDSFTLTDANASERPFASGTRPKPLPTHQDVVWFDVGVQDVAPLEQLESQKQLLTVGAHGLDVQTHVFPVFLEHLSQVHAADETLTPLITKRFGRRAVCEAAARLPERLKHQTKVLLVVEVPEEAKAVELVVRVGVVQLLEELQLF